MTTLFTEAFTNTDGTTWTAHNADWEVYTAGSGSAATVQSNAGRTRITVGSYGGSIFAFHRDSAHTDGRFYFTVVPIAGDPEQYLQVRFRQSDNDDGTSSHTCYVFDMHPGAGWDEIHIQKRVATVDSTLDSAAFAFTGGTTYYGLIEVQGTSIKCWLDTGTWADPDVDIPDLEATDAAIASGSLAFHHFGGNTATTQDGLWDSLTAEDFEPAPTLAASGTTSAQASGASLAVNVPAHSAGDLLLCFVSQRSGTDFAVDGSWVIVDQWEYFESGVSQQRTGGLAAIVASGSGTTLTITVGGSDDIIAKCVRVTGHGVSNPATDIIKGTRVEGNSAAPDPPNLSSLTSGDYLFLAMICLSKDSSGDAITAGSSGYTQIVNDTSGAPTSTSAVNLWAGYKRATGVTGDSPAAGTLNATDAWGAQTYAIPAPTTTQNITPTGPTVSITAGTPSIGLNITPTWASVTVAPGTPGIALSIAPTGPTVSITSGTPAIGLNIAPAGATITITPGTPGFASPDSFVNPTGPTVTITAGTVTIEALDPVYHFTPQRVQVVPRLDREARGPAARLGRHLSSGFRAPNVFILNDGTVTEVSPDGTRVTWDDVARVFYGGHVPEPVTDEEKALLEAAGYTTFLL
jgi:hypothetical protein